ncbi:Protein NAR1, partial [Ananas comosus]
PEDIYHVTVMPCYDKKLEAARDDFIFTLENTENGDENPGLKIVEVDSVLTTGEVLDLIQSKSMDFKALEEAHLTDCCLNGGGQIKPKKGQSSKDLIRQLENIYMQDVLVANPFDNPIAKRLYDEWLGEPGSEKAKKYLHTEYHPLVKSIASQLHNW